jgi:hypothetical protein
VGGVALLCFESTIAAGALHSLSKAIGFSLASGPKVVGQPGPTHFQKEPIKLGHVAQQG